MNRSCSVLARGALAWLAAGWLAAAGCRPAELCQEGTPCGGSPVGEWTARSGCRDPLYQPPTRLTYRNQPQTAAREPPPEATSSDWCSYLVYGATGITNFLFPFDTPKLSGAGVNFNADGSYSARLTTQGDGSVDLPAGCLTRFGAQVTCGPGSGTPDASGPRSLQDDLTAFASQAGSYSGIVCQDAAGGGCHCSYQVQFDPTVGGFWSAGGGVMTLTDSNHRLPSLVDFCLDPATGLLSLWGHNRASIWDQLPGSRTLVLGPPI